MSFDADLVGAFGLWTNVLTEEICERCGSPENHPTDRNRRYIEGPQRDIFDDPPEILIAAA
eukprot:11685812-Karenia_brevis.AAC.1